MNTPIVSVPSAVEAARRYVKANDDLAARFGGIKGRFMDGVALTPELIELSSALLKACEALERLASSEAFDVPRVIDQDRDAELLARMKFARAALSCSAPPEDK